MCRRAVPAFTRAVAFGNYAGELRELLHLLKYEQVRPAADVLGRCLAAAIQQLRPAFDQTPPLVVPVPLHARKRRERGFNQTELIGRSAIKHLAAQGMPLEISTRLLKRQRATSSQTGLTRHQRRANLRGAFTLGHRDAIRERDILVVDDVYTTGTTISECARLLVRGGAKRVFVATVARVLKGEMRRVETEAAKAVSAAAN
jgi:ComF family protein